MYTLNCKNPVVFAGRVVVTVKLPNGDIQPFYKRTGKGTSVLTKEGAQAGDWVPFDGVCEADWWFIKDRFCVGSSRSIVPENRLDLHRFGTDEFKAVSDWLKTVSMEEPVRVTFGDEVNKFLRENC